MTQVKNKIGIIGLGLIGGSVAKALKKSGKGYVIHAFDRDEEVLKTALESRAIDHISNMDDIAGCHVIFLCVPVYAMKQILIELMPNLAPDTILTDVGSTKGEVISIIRELNLECQFIGGHPLAGSEKSGFTASKANLFENAYYCITPSQKMTKEGVQYFKGLIEDMGAIPIEMTHEEHDKATAVISHFPHVVAALLVNMVGCLDDEKHTMKTIAAGGFKDITRIASSSSDLWTGICLSNRDAILKTIEFFSEKLKSFEKDLAEGRKEGIWEFFNSARTLRNTLSDRKSLIDKTYAILVDVDDKPGIIAVIATALAKENINIKNIGILNSRETEEGALEIQFEDENARQMGIKALTQLGYRAKEKE